MKKELIDKFSTLITAAFGLVAALAWNEAIKSLLAKWGYDIYGPVVYACIVTAIAVLVTVWVGKVAERAKKIDLESEFIEQAMKIKRLKAKLKKQK